MFEKSLTEKLSKIFDVKKVRYDLPSDSKEEETLFVEIESARSKIKDAKETAVVRGKLRVFCNPDRFPYGYFSKRIDQADRLDVKDLFFFDIEENAGTFMNISERSMSFVFMYQAQYDPAIGEINSVDFGS